jgi:hypothetical protein
VRRFRTFWLLALAAMLVTAFAPQAFAAWQCDGRVCGTTLWFCCCISPTGQQDVNCGDQKVRAEGPAAGALGCPSECNCVLTLKGAENGRLGAATAPMVVVHALPAVLVSPCLVEPVPTEVVARSLGSRGPPAPKVCLATPVLRGPPALTIPSIGS